MPSQTSILQPQIRLGVADRSEVGAARRAAQELSEAIGLGATQVGTVGLCITEAASNIVKHAGRGQILLRPLSLEEVVGLEILALDRGPGIANVQASLQDGVSTAGSPGTGLGALARASDSFEIYAPAQRGTVLRLEIWSKPPPPSHLEIGAVCLPKAGETVCGDAWTVQGTPGRYTALVADGLGHGMEAARAATAAIGVPSRRPEDDPAQLIELCHRVLAPTRGAAVAVARLSGGGEKGSFAGVGNIAARVEMPDTRRQLVSHNGTLGHTMRRVQQFDFNFAPGGLLILHSDGLATHWNLGEYPGLANRHPATIAGVLYRDHERGRDDVTVLVLRIRAIG
ncbi:MAG TPA: ATP-binding SpoIIE family protein phosphatase [Steroidobacteraceae bacterium]|nr:ATP-binding SpoIIE family protein phosphatase [Steroidobacteraceae bacterium]